MDKKRILLGLALAGAACAAVYGEYGSTKIEVAAPLGVHGPRAETSYAPVRLESLPAREPLGQPKGELFAPHSWAPTRPTVAGRAARPAVAVEPPKAPPIPYRVAGQVVEEDGMRVVLTKGDRIFEVRKGQTLEEGFRLESITPHALTFVYVPLGTSQELAVAGAGLDLSVARNVAAASRTRLRAEVTAPQPLASSADRAQLRFEGPRRVQAGKAFDVALKLTSPQPVRALPMQLSFDAKRLEPVAVRAGSLFAGGNFTYRVNPAGSIFIGASGGGRTAFDDEFLVVTFRPIASGPAELKVSSLVMQGSAGRAIAHEPPKSFRAAIVQ